MKNHIYTFIVGVLVAIFCVHAYNFYQMRSVLVNEVLPVTEFVKSQVQQQQAQQQTPVQEVR